MTAGRLVALGDSITRGGGEPMLGLPAVPWVVLLAEAAGLACENLAGDGATAGDVLHRQVPRAGDGAAIACVYVGVNDARDPAWDAARFGVDLEAILASLAPRARAVLVATMPRDLGRPTAAPKPAAANAIVRAAAGRHGTVVVALDDLAGPDFVLPDAVHLTALGEVEIARRALAALTARRLLAPGAQVRGAPDRSAGAQTAWRRERASLLAADLRRRHGERPTR